MTSTEFDVNWQFFIRTRQNAAWRSFEHELSRELENAFCTPGLARIRLTSKVIGTDGNDVSFVIDLHHMEVRLFSTGEAGIIRRDAATYIAPPGELWEYEESDGCWKPYDLASCELLRIARDSGRTSTVVYSSDERETYSFEIDFELNQHENRSNNKWHNIRLNTECQLIPEFPEPAEELSQLDTEEVDVLTDNVKLASQGNVVDGRQVNIQEEIKQYVEMRHMDGNNSTMKDESYRDNNILVQIPTLLKRLELKSGDIKKVKNTPIGTGGYAKVYKVKYNGEIMAAKVFKMENLTEENSKDIYAMFSKEVCLLSQLQHERIVKFHGFVATTVELALVLEYVQQGSLRSLLNKKSEWNKLLPTQRHQILLDVAEGMLFLHTRNVAHIDLKSDNVLMTNDYRAKITDFGLSKSIEAISSTIKSSIRGTLPFIAPEGFNPSTKDNFKGDVYSFGISVWEVMSGILGREKSVPWAGMDLPQLLCAVYLEGKRPELLVECISDKNVLHSTVVVDVMNQCLNYEPADRPSFDFVVASLNCIELLQGEIENLRAKIQSQEERDRANELLQAEHEELKLEKEQRDHDNKLLQTERDRLKLEKEKFEQEFQLAQIELEKFRLEKSKREGQISDMNVMEKLYELTRGTLWTKNKDRLSWQLNKCTSEFREADDRITYIDLKSNNLTGRIPQELGRLSYLTHLDLSNNKLKGTIPVELGELKHLTYLNLSYNQLTGAVPKELGELKSLTYLNLSYNQLTGAIPKELGELSKLKELHLSDNKLTGKIPVELGNLSKLEKLYLGSQFTGKQAFLIDFTGNQLTGEIPKELGELSKLKELNLNNNKLTGAVPKELGELSELKELILSWNQLTGGPPIIPGCQIIFDPQRR